MTDAQKAKIRTVAQFVVPLIVSLNVVQLALEWVGLDDTIATGVGITVLTAVLTPIYMAVVSFLEANVKPVFGRLFIVAAKPVYEEVAPSWTAEASAA